MRVLSVSGVIPYPPDDGRRVRTWNLLTRVAKTEDVTVLSWLEQDTPASWVERVENDIGPVIAQPLGTFRSGLAPRLGRRATFLIGRSPPYMQAALEERGGLQLAKLLDRVREAHAEQPFDVVVIEEEGLAYLPLPDLGARRVVHRLNVFEKVISASYRRPLQRLVWFAERTGWRRFDRQTLAGADLAVATTSETAEELRRFSATPVVVVPNGVDVRPLQDHPSSGKDLAFVGWMAYHPNVDAALWFARQVWPNIARRFPGSSLRIVGREPTAEVRSLQSDTVSVTGEVDDVVDACQGCRLGVVPLRAGMGIKNKTLELLAMGLPVVSSATGAEGISAGPQDGLLVAGDDRDFTNLVTDLLEDGERADRLGRAARELVLRDHSWDAIGAAYVQELHKVVNS